MDRTERFYKIDQMISERRQVSFADLMDALEVSRATLKRDLDYMRTRLNAPIVWDRETRGYRFDNTNGTAGGKHAKYELPGLWFNANEVHALLTMQHLLTNLDPGGILTPHVQPLMARLNGLLGSTAGDAGNGAEAQSAEAIRRRVMIFGLGKRSLKLAHFEKVGAALIRRKRLTLDYYARGTGEESRREVSPQRLVYYRENWYLDAWCHLREGLRNFAVDSIRAAEIIEKKSCEIPDATLDKHFGAGYGIFSGGKPKTARLLFSAERARWVAQESWHPKQKGHFTADGEWLLELPYTDHRELIMDILKFGADVEVLGPPELRQRVKDEIGRLKQRYSGD